MEHVVSAASPAAGPPGSGAWPALPLTEWQETRDTLHLWTQIVGKVRLALAPAVNHWWHVPLYVDARGLTTSLMPYDGLGLEILFDFGAHELAVLTTQGNSRRMRLEPRSVADFYGEFRSHLRALGVAVPINRTPVELIEATPFDEDHAHASYDPDAVHRFWISLVSAHRVLSRFRGGFRGKSSPVHFFWGAFDLAVTRFSGRPAPAHPGGVPNRYWPNGSAEGIFYAYAYPKPAGYRQHPVEPATAAFDEELGEFVLPYADVRTAAGPDEHLFRFLTSTNEAAVATAGWPDPLRPPGASRA